jgi:hypothetical protein
MLNAPRIWLQYRPVRIGWVIADCDLARIETAASWSSCLWGGRFNPIIPIHDESLAEQLVKAFGIDLLIPIDGTEATQSFIKRFPYLDHNRWREQIFDRRECEFADVRHIARRIAKYPDKRVESALIQPTWESNDPIRQLLTVLLGRYPTPSDQIADYGAGMRRAFGVPEKAILNGGEVPKEMIEGITPLWLTGYEMTRSGRRSGWLGPAIVLGSTTSFDDLVLFWNLGAAGAAACFYDPAQSARLKAFADGFLEKFRNPAAGGPGQVNFWMRPRPSPQSDWHPDLDLTNLQLNVCDGQGPGLWNGLNIQPDRHYFTAWHRDVVPSYEEGNGTATASFALPDRPFDDDDTQSLRQKFVVAIDARQYGNDSDFTFETPFIPEMNQFYGRKFYHDYDAVRANPGSLDKGSVGIITSISTQRMGIRAYHSWDWLAYLFELSGLAIERSEAGLRCKRLINQFGGLRECRVLKIRGVRNLLRRYGVEESFTRSAAIDVIRDFDPRTGIVGFEEFKNLYIESRPSGELKPDDALRYLLSRRVFRVGLELKCPNCELKSWIHLDDVRSTSACPYCDHTYDVTTQLRDRDWRYRRSGIFGRDDNQLGGVPVALTLQQLSDAISDNIIMYSTAVNFRPEGADIEPCEADFVAVVSGAIGISESPVQLLFGEAKTSGSIDEQDIRKLGKLADTIPPHIAQTFILFAKTDAFLADEIRLAKSLNSQYRRRVILWSRDELEPEFVYDRAEGRLGARQYATTLTDMANITQQLWFS